MWWSRRAIGLHAVIIVIIPTFTGLCIWQVDRALDGNQLSWAYVFEWPFFGGYAIYMWWRFLHEVPDSRSPDRPDTRLTTGPVESGGAPTTVSGPETGATDAEDERAAYNDYLSQLATRGKRKQWR